MSSAPESIPPTCTHERRPGTTVCLLCRQEARVAASDRRKKVLLRGTAGAIVIAVIAIGMSNASALRGRTIAKAKVPTDSAASARIDTATSVPTDSVLPAGSLGTAPLAAPVVTHPTPTAPTSAGSSMPMSPVIHVGDTPLGNGVVATRSDSGVLVAFDTPDLRTRMPEKFERFLRATLPQVYGPSIEAKLTSIPAGQLVAQGNLLYALPTRGIHLPLQPGWHLEVYPEIRPGEEGPLVVRYRTSVVKE